MPKSDNGLPGLTQTLESSSVWVTGNLESVGGILIKIWTNFNKNGDNTPTYLLDTAHKKHSLEIIWLYKKSPSSQSGPDTDTGTTWEINLPDVAFWGKFLCSSNDSGGLQPFAWDQIWPGTVETSQSDGSHAVSRPHPGAARVQWGNNNFPLRDLLSVFPPSADVTFARYRKIHILARYF